MPEPDDDKPFVTGAEALGITNDPTPPTPGLSVTPDLVEVPNSPVPNASHSHVMGPQQAAADPVLAGLDTRHHPLSTAENRAITRETGETVAAVPDKASEEAPGPNGTSQAPTAAAEVPKQGESPRPPRAARQTTPTDPA